ncbi:MAG: serine/threonine protein phosphatase [Clostridia bacterium]|nr:serine/threonine protein phosphatase [Clostridia bacterium]
MALYTIADLHLSTLESTNKSMEVFGQRWQDYMLRIAGNWRRLVTDLDTVVIPGDVSWALSLEEAVSDLKFIDSLPGKKIIGKGNHDFWWATMRKHEELFKKENISTISFLFNNAHELDDFIVAGTRGWYYDDDCKNMPKNSDFQKLTRREAMRLRMSLEAAKKLKEESGKEIIAFMHFPPFWAGEESGELCDILIEYGIEELYFGHIHGNYTLPLHFSHRGINMHMISADHVDFTPVRVHPHGVIEAESEE